MVSITFPALKLKHVKIGFRCLVDHILLATLIPIAATSAAYHLHLNILQLLFSSFSIIIIFTIYSIFKPKPIYLLDYSCHNPSKALRSPFSVFMESSKITQKDSPKSVEFQMRILERSGSSEETCLAPGFHYILPRTTTEDSRVEAELVIFSNVDSLFEKTNRKPSDVDILIVNCSVFSPAPSLVSMVMNKYKMRSDVKCYNLSDMGCSVGLIAIDFAKYLLNNHQNSSVIVISTEIITPNYYSGNDLSMLLSNCLCRLGGAAMLLSNKHQEQDRAKYKLVNIVRTHHESNEESYKAIHHIEDHGNLGIKLAKNLLVFAGKALKLNIMTLGPSVLPISEQLLFVLNLIGTRIFNRKWKPYIPDFTQAFEHFCIHAGGREIINKMQKNLGLSVRTY